MSETVFQPPPPPPVDPNEEWRRAWGKYPRRPEKEGYGRTPGAAATEVDRADRRREALRKRWGLEATDLREPYESARANELGINPPVPDRRTTIAGSSAWTPQFIADLEERAGGDPQGRRPTEEARELWRNMTPEAQERVSTQTAKENSATGRATRDLHDKENVMRYLGKGTEAVMGVVKDAYQGGQDENGVYRWAYTQTPEQLAEFRKFIEIHGDEITLEDLKERPDGTR